MKYIVVFDEEPKWSHDTTLGKLYDVTKERGSLGDVLHYNDEKDEVVELSLRHPCEIILI